MHFCDSFSETVGSMSFWEEEFNTSLADAFIAKNINQY